MKKNLFLTIMFFSYCASPSAQTCPPGRLFNPATDICYDCVFPIKIGGVPVAPSPLPQETTQTPQENQPVCVCPKPPAGQPTPGIPVTMWSPNFLIETASHPFCFPTMGGLGLNMLPNYMLQGTSASTMKNETGMAQIHKIDFPVLKFLKLPVSAACVMSMDIGVPYLSETDALWQNDLLAFLISPEVLLFAYPPTIIACMADAVSSTFKSPLDPLFWCAGTFGTVYPLSGHFSNDPLEGHALLAARAIFKLSRMGAIMNESFNICATMYLPIWIKSHFRMHLAMPTRDITCHSIGASMFTQGAKKPPNVSDLVWAIFQKKSCCAL